MIIDLAKSAEALKASKRHREHNQRLATVTGKNPTLATNPTALRLMVMSLEAQEGMA